MDTASLEKHVRRLQGEVPRLRRGIVTDTSPLTVAINGDPDNAYPAAGFVGAGAGLEVDEPVAVILRGGTCLVLGTLNVDMIDGGRIEPGSITAEHIVAGSIEAEHIVAGAITTELLAAGAVTADKIQAGTITATEIAANAITATHIQAGSINATHIQADAINATHIQANSITTAHLQANSVVAGKIAANSITTAHLQADSITAGKIAADSITTAHLQANSVVAGKIAANSITTGHLQADSVVAGKIAANSITASHIQAGVITATHIQAGSITADRLVANTITAGYIAAHTITAGEILAGTITADEIAANAITTAKLNAGAVTAAKIQAGTITATEIAADAITTTHLQADSITSVKIAASQITSTHIQANAIQSSHIAAGQVTATQLATDSVTATKILAGAVTASKISVTSLAAISADLGTITAGTITGATFRTSSSNPKVQMDVNGVFAYDSSGTATFWIDAVTGKVLTLSGIGGFNRLSNSSFENTLSATTGYQVSGASGGGGTIAGSTAQFKHGAQSCLLTSTGATGQAGFSTTNAASPAAKPGITYTASAWVYPTTSGRAAVVIIQFLDASNASLGSTTGTLAAPTVNDWNRISVTATAPASTVKMRIICRIASGAIGETSYWDMLQMEEGTLVTAYTPKADEVLPRTITGGTSGELALNTLTADNIVAATITATELATDSVTTAKILAGNITTAKLAAGAVTTNELDALAVTTAKLAAGAVTADKITVTSLSAITADLGTITAGTITGATFRTSSANPKVQMDSSGLASYDSSGNAVVSVTTSGFKLLAGTASSPPSERQIRWMEGSNVVVAQAVYKSGTVSNYVLSVYDPTAQVSRSRLEFNYDTSGFSSAQLWGISPNGSKWASIIFWASNTSNSEQIEVQTTSVSTNNILLKNDGTSDWLRLTTAQTVSGAKTFSANLTMNAANIVMGNNKVTGLAAGTANGDAIRFEDGVRITGTQTITGTKLFSALATGSYHQAADGTNRLLFVASAETRFRSGWDSNNLFEFYNNSNVIKAKIDSTGAYTALSDERTKHAIATVDAEDVLRRFEGEPVKRFRYHTAPEELFMGFTAQQFRRAFPELTPVQEMGPYLGISYSDRLGVLEAVGQALATRLRKTAQAADQRLDTLEQAVLKLAREIARLKEDK